MKLKKKEGLDPLFLYNKSMQFIKFFICLLLISSCGGGGGGVGNCAHAANGGSGVVIIRYKNQ